MTRILGLTQGQQLNVVVDQTERAVSCRWLVDASGRAAMLARKSKVGILNWFRPMSNAPSQLRHFAAGGVFWRQCLDWGVINVPFYLQPMMIFFWTLVFFFLSADARRSALRNLSMVRSKSSMFVNYFRVFRTFYNFAWTMTDTAAHRLLKIPFSYELIGEEFLN